MKRACGHQGYGQQIEEIGQAEPQRPYARIHYRHADAHDRQEQAHVAQDIGGAFSRPLLGDPVGFHHQPGGPEQRIAEQQGHSRHETVCIEPVERMARQSFALPPAPP